MKRSVEAIAGTDPYQPHLYPSEQFQFNWITNYVVAYSNLNFVSPRGEPSDAQHLNTQQLNSDNCRLSVEQVTNQACKLMRQVRYFTLHAHFFWGIWALLQAAHSSIDFDFIGYGLLRLKEYEKSKCQLLS